MNPLDKTPLFAGGPAVSRLCLGTMMFGDQTDRDEAGRIVERFMAAGGTFIDTADTYADGRSETMLGALIREMRGEVFLATKVGNAVGDVAGSGGLSARWIARAAEMSLGRLGTDRIDLYYLHREDDRVPLDETVAAIGALLRSGMVAHWGFSNFRPWKIAEMVRLADGMGIARPVAAQPYYHLLNRLAEADTIPACRHFGIGVVPYSPLARGVLTGKYRVGRPAGSRAARADQRIMETEFLPETLALAARAADYAEQRGVEPTGMALRWVLANDAVSSVLVGPKSLSQLDAYLEAAASPYAERDERFLSSLCAPGDTPVPGHHDPRYPLDGRHVSL